MRSIKIINDENSKFRIDQQILIVEQLTKVANALEELVNLTRKKVDSSTTTGLL